MMGGVEEDAEQRGYRVFLLGIQGVRKCVNNE